MIVFIGDSYVAPEAPGVIAFSALVDAPVRAEGFSGATTRAWAFMDDARLRLALRGASLVLVHLGLNDSRPSASSYHALEERLQAIAPARVVWVVPPNAPTADREAISRALFGASLQRLIILPPFPQEAFRPDGLHLTRPGGVLWAEALLSQLERFGVSRRGSAPRGSMLMPALLLLGLGWGLWKVAT